MTESRLSTPPGAEYRKMTSPPRATKTRAAAGGGPVIVGYGAVFYNPADPGTEFTLWPGLVERIDPGAFDETLRVDNVRGLFNHEPTLLLGTTAAGSLTLSVDSVGLFYEIRPADTFVAADVVAWIAAGELVGSSISFVVEAEEWEAGGDGEPDIRTLKKVKLFDCGPVTFPAFTGTTAGVQKPSRKARSRFELPVDATGRAQPDSVRAESNRILATLNRRKREIDLLKLVGGAA